MILSNNTSSQSGCSNGKCENCALSLICSKSPFCAIRNKSDNSQALNNITEELRSLGSIITLFDQTLQNISHDIIKQISHSETSMMADMHNINVINKDMLEKILISLDDLKNNPKLKDVEESTYNGFIIEDTPSTNLAEYTGEKQEVPVLVEKKNLFGKTKWVEEK